jgi:tetratricopeptide (TPR) repeat protein
MKKLNVFVSLSVILFLAAALNTKAQQIRTPSPSPTSKVTQNVGLTDITITYSRPGVKDRVIMGNIVAYGQMWRTGANASTRFEISDDITVEGKPLKAGAYSLFTIPNENEWTIIFNSNVQAGIGNYKESEEALRVNVKPVKLPVKVETFLIDINDIRNESATLNLIWENTLVAAKIGTDVDSKVMADIKRAMDPVADAGKYYAAANYYYSSGKDLKQALEWVNKSMELDGSRYWVAQLKAGILGKLGSYKEAITTAETAKELATKAGNNDAVRANEASIAEWKKMK